MNSLEFYRNIKTDHDRETVEFTVDKEKLKTINVNADNEIKLKLTIHDFSKTIK